MRLIILTLSITKVSLALEHNSNVQKIGLYLHEGSTPTIQKIQHPINTLVISKDQFSNILSQDRDFIINYISTRIIIFF